MEIKFTRPQNARFRCRNRFNQVMREYRVGSCASAIFTVSDKILADRDHTQTTIGGRSEYNGKTVLERRRRWQARRIALLLGGG